MMEFGAVGGPRFVREAAGKVAEVNQFHKEQQHGDTGEDGTQGSGSGAHDDGSDAPGLVE